MSLSGNMSIPDQLDYVIKEGCWLGVHMRCAHIAKLLADERMPDFNFKEQLWHIARANAPEAAEYLCLLLRTQFGFQTRNEGKSFFHDCLTDRKDEVHGPLAVIFSGVSFGL